MLYDLDGSGARTMLLLYNIHLLVALYLLQWEVGDTSIWNPSGYGRGSWWLRRQSWRGVACIDRQLKTAEGGCSTVVYVLSVSTNRRHFLRENTAESTHESWSDRVSNLWLKEEERNQCSWMGAHGLHQLYCHTPILACFGIKLCKRITPHFWMIGCYTQMAPLESHRRWAVCIHFSSPWEGKWLPFSFITTSMLSSYLRPLWS